MKNLKKIATLGSSGIGKLVMPEPPKPKVVIVGISNDKEACIKAIEATENLGFECLVVDPRVIIGTPEKTMESLKLIGTVYDANIIYPPSKSKYHK